jgi:hypothetical protein
MAISVAYPGRDGAHSAAACDQLFPGGAELVPLRSLQPPSTSAEGSWRGCLARPRVRRGRRPFHSRRNRTAILGHVKNRGAGLGWVLAALGLAVGFVYVTFVGSVLNSCGAGNHGPNPGAEERFCGYGSGEPSDYSALFVFVQLIPAIPALVGGLLAGLGRSRLFFGAGAAVSVLSTALIWALEP